MQRDGRASLPEDSLALILIRVCGMRGLEEVAPLVDDALRDGLRQESRGVFIP